MKINFITLIIALALAALAAYGFYTADGGETAIFRAIGGGLMLFVTLSGAIALVIENDRGAVLNIRIISFVFFTIVLIIQIVFCFVLFRITPYIIINGIMLLLYILIAYSIGSRLQGKK